MNLEYTRGCMACSLTADGTEEVDMTDEQRTAVKKKICEWIMKEADLNELMRLLIEHTPTSMRATTSRANVAAIMWKLINGGYDRQERKDF